MSSAHAHTPSPVAVVPMGKRMPDGTWVDGYAVLLVQDGVLRRQWRPTKDRANRLRARIIRRRTRDLD